MSSTMKSILTGFALIKSKGLALVESAPTITPIPTSTENPIINTRNTQIENPKFEGSQITHKCVAEILEAENLFSSLFDFLESVEKNIRRAVKDSNGNPNKAHKPNRFSIIGFLKRVKTSILNFESIKNIPSAVLKKIITFEHNFTSNFSNNQKILFRESLFLAPLLPLISPVKFLSGAAASVSQLFNDLLLLPAFISVSFKMWHPSDAVQLSKHRYTVFQSRLMKFFLSLQLPLSVFGRPEGDLFFVNQTIYCDSLPQDTLFQDFPPSKTSKENCKSFEAFEIMGNNRTKILAGFIYAVSGHWQDSKRVHIPLDWCDNIFKECMSLPVIQQRFINLLKHENASEFLTSLNETCFPEIVHGDLCIARGNIRGLIDAACQMIFGNARECFLEKEADRRAEINSVFQALAGTMLFVCLCLALCHITDQSQKQDKSSQNNDQSEKQRQQQVSTRRHEQNQPIPAQASAENPQQESLQINTQAQTQPNVPQDELQSNAAEIFVIHSTDDRQNTLEANAPGTRATQEKSGKPHQKKLKSPENFGIAMAQIKCNLSEPLLVSNDDSKPLLPFGNFEESDAFNPVIFSTGPYQIPSNESAYVYTKLDDNNRDKTAYKSS